MALKRKFDARTWLAEARPEIGAAAILSGVFSVLMLLLAWTGYHGMHRSVRSIQITFTEALARLALGFVLLFFPLLVLLRRDRRYGYVRKADLSRQGKGRGHARRAQSPLVGALGWLERVLAPRAAARRRAILRAPFPRAWQKSLDARHRHYRRMPRPLRKEFDRQVQLFLAEKRITGIEIALDDELRLLVAASAVTLSAGWPGYTWDQLTEVLLYPQDFDRDYAFGGNELAGQAHHWGTVILSVPTLRRSFAEPDRHHVGLHEFAHLLDLEQTRFDGIPPGLPDDAIRRWETICRQEHDRLLRGDSALDPYGLSATTEFFAVAVEAFFETPAAVLECHPELYEFLSSYFGQDPAGWDASTRGRF